MEDHLVDKVTIEKTTISQINQLSGKDCLMNSCEPMVLSSFFLSGFLVNPEPAKEWHKMS